MRPIHRLIPAVLLVLFCVIILKASIPQVPTGTWANGDPLSVARTGATATLLPDGRVLIAGGQDASGNALASADLFNVDGSVSAAPPMSTPRYGHSAIFLMDGYVLVAGGHTSGGGVTNTAELFDPLTNTWQSLGVMSDPRADFTMSQLQDGDVLLVGGDNGSAPLSSIEKFVLTANSFQPSGAIVSARKSHAAAALNDGRVIIAGGSGLDSSSNAIALNSSEIFDPASNSVSAGPALNTARFAHTATTLIDGTVLLAGGNDGTNDLASAEIYDPAAGTITASASSLATPRSHHTALLLPNNNSVLIAGGTSAGTDLKSTELYQSWNHAFIANADMSVPRANAVSSPVSTDGVALLAGGSNESSTEFYGFATVKTDQRDYSPGETVTITGTGWKPGETVTLSLQESPSVDAPGPFIATADGSGNILNTEFVPDAQDIGTRFYLTALGTTSGFQAHNTFTDGNITSLSGKVTNSVTNLPIAGVTVRCDNTSGCNATITTTTAADGTYSFAGGNKLSFSGNGPTTITLTASLSGFTSGQQTLTNVNNSDIRTNVNFSLTPSIAATSLSVATASGSYGGTTNLSATLTSGGSGVVGKTISFSLNGGTAITATTGAGGVATLSNVSLSGINAGTYAPGANSGVAASFAGDSSFAAAAASNTLTVAKANASITVTPYSVTYDGNAHTATGTATGVGGADLSASLTLSGTTHTDAGDYTTDAWSFSGGTNYNDATGTVHDQIGKADAIITVTPYHVTYDGDPHTAAGSAKGVKNESLTGLDLTHTTHTGAGTYASDYWSFTDVTGNYNNVANTTITDVIDKANATIAVTPYHVTYDGDPHTAAGSAKGVKNESLSGLDLTHTTHTGAGTYASDYWSFTDVTGNYNNVANTTITDVIDKANATITVTPYHVTYDGDPHTATGSAKGVKNESLSGLDLTHTTHTDAGTYASDYWSFTDVTGNYNNAANTTITDVIDKANATINVTPYHVTYNGDPHTATGTATGVKGEVLAGLDLSGTTHTDAGDYLSDPWTFTAPNTNYNNTSGTTHDQIDKANATINVTPYHVTYDGDPYTATGTATGVKGEALAGLDLSGTSHTAAGDYPSDPWVFAAPNTNYNNANGTTHDQIDKANATISVTPYHVTYDGDPHTATGTATGVKGEALAGLDLSATTHTGAGDYATDPWTFTAPNTNYNNASGTTHDQIDKANATIAVTPYHVTYDGDPHTATGTATGVKGESLSGLVLSGTTHQDAGDYPTDPWTFTDSTGNYNNTTGTTHDQIDKANAIIVVTPYSVTYDTDAHTATGTATGVKGESLAGLVLSGTTHTDAGDYTSDPWSFTNANYNDASGTVHDIIAKANATIVVTPYSVTYDTDPHTATGTAKGVKGESLTGLVLTGTTHTDAGDYTADAWSFTNVNYNDASGTVHDVIAKATATIVVTPYSVTYDTEAHTATGTATGVKGESLSGLVLTGTTHTGAGDYPSDPWSFTNPNYNDASGTVHDSIAKATAVIAVTPYNVTYDGDPHTATGTATGVKGESLAGLILTSTTHTYAGDYPSDPWTFTNPNYNDAGGTVHDSIAKANPTINVTPYSVTYDGNSHTATGTATGAKGEALAGLNLSGTTHTGAGTYSTDSWTFTDVTGNYNNASGTVSDSIAKANATINVSGYSVIYDSNPHTATGTAIGVKGETLSGLNLSGTTHTIPGSYTDTWTFTDVTGNYNNASNTVTDTISFGTCSAAIGPGNVILPPINSDGTSVYNRKGGSTIPVKFRVCDAYGNPISSQTAVFGSSSAGSITMLNAVRGTVDNANEAGTTDIPDVAFRYSGGQWIFNMATSNLSSGATYQFRINLAYGRILFVVGVK